LERAARRELSEELGVRAKELTWFAAYDFAQRGRQIRYGLYYVDLMEGWPSVVESETFDRLHFFTFEELCGHQAELSPNVRGILSMLATGQMKAQRARSSHVRQLRHNGAVGRDGHTDGSRRAERCASSTLKGAAKS
jgi:ADP-ribose pyrophosphatase YjhB (NUDIX family)